MRRSTPQKGSPYSAIPHRHTNRGPYYTTPLPIDFLQALRRMASGESDLKVILFADENVYPRLISIVSDANDALYFDPQVQRGSERWFRNSWQEIQQVATGLFWMIHARVHC